MEARAARHVAEAPHIRQRRELIAKRELHNVEPRRWPLHAAEQHRLPRPESARLGDAFENAQHNAAARLLQRCDAQHERVGTQLLCGGGSPLSAQRCRALRRLDADQIVQR